MCGRFTRTTPVKDLARLFDFPDPGAEEPPPRYNIAPSQSVAVVRPAPDRPGRELAWLRWGLIPSWSDDPKIAYKLINARADTVAGKPAFRNAFRQRHCLIPADSFYEWHAAGTKTKQPYCIRRQDRQPFAIAGLWEHWNNPEGPPIESCSIITTEANEVVRPIHDRMPVILDPADYAAWLDPRDPTIAHELLRPCPAELMAAFPVSSMVNNPKNEDPRCLEAVAD